MISYRINSENEQYDACANTLRHNEKSIEDACKTMCRGGMSYGYEQSNWGETYQRT